jgi:hypothetical protein
LRFERPAAIVIEPKSPPRPPALDLHEMSLRDSPSAANAPMLTFAPSRGAGPGGAAEADAVAVAGGVVGAATLAAAGLAVTLAVAVTVGSELGLVVGVRVAGAAGSAVGSGAEGSSGVDGSAPQPRSATQRARVLMRGTLGRQTVPPQYDLRR